MTPDSASLLIQEKQARQRFDRALAALRAQDAETGPSAVQAEVEEARRSWEAARKRLDAFQAEAG